MKKILSVLLAVLLLACSMPVSAVVITDNLPLTFTPADAVGAVSDTPTSITIYSPNLDNSVYSFTAPETNTFRIYATNKDNQNGVSFRVYTSDGRQLVPVANTDYCDFSGSEGETYYVIPYLISTTDTNVTVADVYVLGKVEPTSIGFSKDTMYGYVGDDSATIYPVFGPDNAKWVELSYASSNPTVAEAKNGLLYFYSEGTTTITATYKELEASFNVVVREKETVTLGGAFHFSMDNNDNRYVVQFTPDEDGIYNIGVMSGDNYVEVVIYDDNGTSLSSSGGSYGYNMDVMLTGGKTYDIKYSFYSNSDISSFTVESAVNKMTPATSIEIAEGETATLFVGDTLLLSFNLPDYSYVENVEWSSDNSLVAVVDENGEIYAKASGTANITVTADGGIADTILITVKGAEKVVEGVLNVELETDDSCIFEFTPAVSGDYIIAFVEDSDYTFTSLTEDTSGMFEVIGYSSVYTLQEGKTYRITPQSGDMAVSLKILIEKIVPVKSVEIETYPKKMEYFEYQWVDYEGLTVRVTLEDDRSVVVKPYEAAFGYEVMIEDIYVNDSYETTDYIETVITVGGITKTFNYMIMTTDVERIELNSAPTKEYIWGDLEYGMLDALGNGPNRFYCIYDLDFTGLSFTVYFKNGTQKTYTAEDLDLDNYIIDGFDFWAQCICVEPGTSTVEFEYKGVMLNYDITVHDTPVESVEITKLPENLAEAQQVFMLDFTGMEITVHYKDSTQKSVILDGSNMQYRAEMYRGVYALADVFGHTMRLTNTTNEYGEFTGCFVEYLGFEEDITVLETPETHKDIESIELTDITNFTADGASFKVTYSDSTNETLNLETVVCELGESLEGEYEVYSVLAKTANGFVEYTVEINYVDEKIYYYIPYSEPIELDLGAFNTNDVDGNGVTDTSDLSVLKLLLANPDSIMGVVFGDVNGDGSVDTSDLSALKLFLAGA